jgi:hypothetical protein
MIFAQYLGFWQVFALLEPGLAMFLLTIVTNRVAVMPNTFKRHIVSNS